MEGVAGNVAPADGSFPGGGWRARSQQLPSGGIRPPPSEGLKGGEVPQLHRPPFWLRKRWQVALHELADRAMVKEGWPT